MDATTKYAELEIALHRPTTDGGYQVELRFTRLDSESEMPPERGAVAFDLDKLAVEDDPEAYGTLLAESLFPPANDKVLDLYKEARAVVESGGGFLRLLLLVGPSAAELQGLRWELLHDPKTKKPLATSERTLFSRFMVSYDWRPVRLRPKDELEALVAVAAPSDVGRYRLADVDLDGEIGRAEAALEGVRVDFAGRDKPLTLELLADRLRGHVDILYLVCHGVLKSKTKEPFLFLQNADGTTARVAGAELANRIAELQQPPRLVVLASCESAGSERGFGVQGEALAQSSLAPRLAEAGVAAVVAMQGRITMKTVEAAMPVFFRELLKDGQIDRAMAAARGEVRGRGDCWMPALYLRLKRGRIWYEPGFLADGESFDKWDAIVAGLKTRSVTPVIGSGLVEHVYGNEREIARRLAAATDFPLALHQLEELPQVAQCYRVSQDKKTLRAKVKEILGEAIRERHPEAVRDLGESAKLGKLVRRAAEHLWSRDDGAAEPHRILARLPCPIFVTANQDDLLQLALEKEGKDPRRLICRFREKAAGERHEKPTAQEPLVFHLLGHFKDDDSLVLTQDDFFDFLIRVSKDDTHVPKSIDAAMVKTSVLFLGFELNDWSFRVLFRRLKSLGGQDFLAENTHVMVQVAPGSEDHVDPERARRYLAQYFPDQQLSKASVYWGTTADFLRDLDKRIAGVEWPADEEDEDDY